MPFRKSKSVVEVRPGGTVYKIYLVDNNIVWYLQYKLSHQFKDHLKTAVRKPQTSKHFTHLRWTQLQFGLPDDNPSNPDGYCSYLEPQLARLIYCRSTRNCLSSILGTSILPMAPDGYFKSISAFKSSPLSPGWFVTGRSGLV